MYSKKCQLNGYKKFLLNRVTATASLTEYIETCLTRDDEANKHSFHKIMVHNWPDTAEQLFSIINDYFSSMFIPIQYSNQNNLATFYTSNLSLILKIKKLDFMFPYERNMYNIDILFNDRSSAAFFDNWISVEDIVGSVVSNRLNEKLELDLSNFCNDAEFLEKKIYFYRLSLLAHYKILMLRMGRDTQFLNLSGNNLRQLPMDILNFFIKGNLIGINLSNNDITSMSDLQRYSSKIEKIWLEGNPFCEEMDAPTYVKQITMKFPRVNEIDGVKLNENGLVLPFFKNFAITPDKHTKMLMEKFLSLYFSHFDHSRNRIDAFYDAHSQLTMTNPFTEEEEAILPPVIASDSRNALHPMKNKKKGFLGFFRKHFNTKGKVLSALRRFPETVHDPTTFCVDIINKDRVAKGIETAHDPTKFFVDVIRKDKTHMVVVIDGVLKLVADVPKNVFSFRRTFIFKVMFQHPSTKYYIAHEMLHLDFATPEQIQNSFLHPSRNLYDYALINPDPEEKEIVCNAFCYLTQLRKEEALSRLNSYDWDLKKALKFFKRELKADSIPMEKFAVDLDGADLSADENEGMDIEEVD